MINVGAPEITLVDKLKEFTNKSYDLLTYVHCGMELAENILSSEHAKKDVSAIRTKISELAEIISNFKIGIDETKSPNKLWITWNKTGSADQYYYRNDKVLTEKMLSFIIMSFEKEIGQRLSIIETTNNGYISFCSNIKSMLHKIITNYMTA